MSLVHTLALYKGAWHSRHNSHSNQHRGAASQPAPVEVEEEPSWDEVMMAQLMMRTRASLMATAKDHGVVGRHKMKKADLAEAIIFSPWSPL